MKKVTLVFLLVAFVSLVALGAPKKKTKAPPPKPPTDKPDVSLVEPRGIQRGVETQIKVTGTNLSHLLTFKSVNPKLKGELLEETEKSTEASIKLTAANDLVRGPYEFSLTNTNGESSKVKIYVDDLPQVSEDESAKTGQLIKIPADFWGTFSKPGDSDQIEFDAKAGQQLVFDVAAKSIGSKAAVAAELFSSNGALVASGNSFDGGDPLFAFKAPAGARYRLRLHEQMAAGSKDHFYRVTIGELPVVAGIYPLGIPADAESEIELIGFNLPSASTVKLTAEMAGQKDVPIDSEKFRSRKDFKVLVGDKTEGRESEPNDLPAQATKMNVPGVMNGRIWSSKPGQPADVDVFEFEARADQHLVIETDAARRGSPVDTKIEILGGDGKPVERVLLQAMRDSSLTFRPIDSVTDDARVENWREMELTQLMYMQGEVCKIFRMPQGPDSGFQFFSHGGKRRDYFDTSGMAHALDEPCYIVEPHPPGSKLVPNGLPVFTLYYANDDDGERKLGMDSCVNFTAPAEGKYLVRVSDTRGHGGERYAYRLTIREAKPDFNVAAPAIPAVAPGSGQDFVLSADRLDGFDGDIRLDISGMPDGFSCSTPVVIQAGHLAASSTINAVRDAKDPKESKIKITATASINGHEVTKEITPTGKVTLAPKPKLLVALEPYDEANTNFIERAVTDKPLEVTVVPGHTVPVWLKVKREGHADLVTFTVDNLPHGVIVDNIGLNGVLIPKDQDERQIFLSAARWVAETDRLVYAQANQAGKPTSLPVLLHVRKAAGKAVAEVK